MGQRPHVFAPGQWPLGLPVRLSGRVHKHVVGGQVRADMPEALVTSALQRALLAQRPASGLMVRSDWGGQYVGNAYKTLLRGAKAQLSHSRRGECDNNAQAENRLKVLGA